MVAGLTHNFINPDTQYQNGIDAHIDWAASKFLSPQFHVGVAGYLYQQLTGDSGSGATLGGGNELDHGLRVGAGQAIPDHAVRFS